MKNNKGWIIFGIFVIAAIVAFAVYRVAGTKNTTTISGGGSTIKSTKGLLGILEGLNLNLSLV